MSAIQPNFKSSRAFPVSTSDVARDQANPMSASQSWELLYLSQRAEQPHLYAGDLSARDAATLIARLRLQLDG